MLTNKRGTRYQILKSSTCALLAGASLLQAALTVFAADIDDGAALDPLVRINPQYPEQALSAGMEGWVQLEYTVTGSGTVEDPVAVDAGVCPKDQDRESCRPDDMFKSAALAAITQWRYAPQVENGKAVSRPGVQMIMRFSLGEPKAPAQ